MNIIVSQSVIDAIPWIVSTLKKMGFPQLAVENCKTGIIATIRQHFRNLSAHMPGYCRYNIPGKKYRFIFRYRMSNDRTKALLTGVSIGKRELHEQKRKVIRLTEADIRHCIEKIMSRLLTEGFDFPHELSRKEVLERFSKKLSSLYLEGKISEDDFNELSHYFLYFSPNYANGYEEDKKD